MAGATRNLSMLAAAALWSVVASITGGFLIASYTISGITPPYAASSRPERPTMRIVPPGDWREAGYRKIGLWDEPAAEDRSALPNDQPAGSSRL